MAKCNQLISLPFKGLRRRHLEARQCLTVGRWRWQRL